MASKLKIRKDINNRIEVFNNCSLVNNYFKTNHYTNENHLIFYNKIIKNKIHNRCVLTGRSRSVYRHMRLTRMVLKKLSVYGLLPGIKKISW